jgi:SAM-dependent methyltransferase
MADQIISRITRRLRRDGIRAFTAQAFEIAVLGVASMLLAPLRRRASQEPFYQVFEHFRSALQKKPGGSVLEIGSRNVSGLIRRGLIGDEAHYTGFDIHPGENVDVVGDAHALTTSFPAGHFDAVFSVSVFEHLAMPWKVLLEINRVMKTGGLLYISTHPVWPAHELPWDFWRFSAETFRVLLNEATGFEIIECVEGNPARIVSLSGDPATRGALLARVNQSVAVLARKSGEPASGLEWNMATAAILKTVYPSPVSTVSHGG